METEIKTAIQSKIEADRAAAVELSNSRIAVVEDAFVKVFGVAPKNVLVFRDRTLHDIDFSQRSIAGSAEVGGREYLFMVYPGTYPSVKLHHAKPSWRRRPAIRTAAQLLADLS